MPSSEELRKLTKYVEREDIDDRFVDFPERVRIHEGFASIEFTRIRWKEPNPPNRPSGTRVPVCRLVMPVSCLIALTEKCNRLLAAVQQSSPPVGPQPPTSIQ